MKPFPFLVLSLVAIPVWAQNPVTIHVVDEKNSPVAGALIETQIWVDGAKPIPAVVTDAKGDATFSIPFKPDDKSVGALIVVAARGFAFTNAALNSPKVEVHLERGATWRGQVVDEAGKPLAGAKVRLTGAMNDQDRQNRLRLFGEKITTLYTSQSGADGRFQIADVPAKLGLQYGVEHPDYALKAGRNVLASAEEIVKLAPGGRLHGRVLDVEGKPLVGASVNARPVPFGEGGNVAKADENGVFTISGLGAGTFNLNAYFEVNKPVDFVMPRLSGVTVTTGKTLEVPDLRAVKGVEIRGLVRDAVTKAPLVGVGVVAQQKDDGSSYGDTDATGHFKLRVLAGTHQVYISGPPAGYIRPELQKNVSAGDETLGEVVFELKKAAVLRGKIVDEAGKPLQAKVKIDYDSFIESDAKGVWKWTPQNDQTLQLAGGDAEGGYFEVVRPLSIDPGIEESITIVLRKKPWQVLPGRVLSVDGTPLEGVQIEGEFYTSMGDGNGTLNTSQLSATTNKNGDFVLLHIRDGIRSDSNYFKIKGKKAGYAFQKGGVLSKNGPIWQVSDFIFTPLNLVIEGVTRPGARLTAAGSEIVADAAGKFAFEGLPAGAQVFAFKDGLFGGGEGKSPLQIELKPQAVQARDVALARQIWADIARDAALTPEGKTYRSLGWIEGHLAAETPTFASQIEKSRDDTTILSLVARWAGKTDVKALEAALSKIHDPDTRLYGYLDTAIKADDAAFGARAIAEAEAAFARPEKDAWWREMNLYRAAAVTAKFAGQEAGFAALDRAIAYTLKNHGAKSTRVNAMPDQTGQNEMFALQSANVAQGGRALWQRLLENIEPGGGYDVRSLGEAIPILAQLEGAEAVLPLLDQLEKMPAGIKRDEGYSMQPQQAFSQAAAKVVALWAQKSPEKALQLANRIADDGYSGNRSNALASVARVQTGPAAAKLWREIVKAAPVESAPRFAARAGETDPDLGRELFEVVRQKVEAQTKPEWGDRALWATFAFYFARVDAAQARFLLEREWAAANQKATEGDLLGSIAFAMSAIDARRALEMAKAVPNNYRQSSFETRRKIGQFLNLPDAARRDYPLGGRNYEELRDLDAE